MPLHVVPKEKGHEHGPPHIWKFGGALAALVERGESIGAQHFEKLKQYLAEHGSYTIAEKSEEVQFFRCEKMYDASNMRILLQIARMSTRKQFIDSLKQTGAVLKYGRAPKTYNERDLQAWLESMG